MTNMVLAKTIDGSRVRFFRSPLDGPDFPWVCAEDLMRAAGFSGEMVNGMLQSAANQRGEGFTIEDIRKIAYGDELLTIWAHYCGTGFIDAMIECERLPEKSRAEFAVAAAQAAGETTKGLPPEVFMRQLISAARRRSPPPPSGEGGK